MRLFPDRRDHHGSHSHDIAPGRIEALTDEQRRQSGVVPELQLSDLVLRIPVACMAVRAKGKRPLVCGTLPHAAALVEGGGVLAHMRCFPARLHPALEAGELSDLAQIAGVMPGQFLRPLELVVDVRR
jgi:hypothetical protein